MGLRLLMIECYGSNYGIEHVLGDAGFLSSTVGFHMGLGFRGGFCGIEVIIVTIIVTVGLPALRKTETKSVNSNPVCKWFGTLSIKHLQETAPFTGELAFLRINASMVS